MIIFLQLLTNVDMVVMPLVSVNVRTMILMGTKVVVNNWRTLCNMHCNVPDTEHQSIVVLINVL